MRQSNQRFLIHIDEGLREVVDVDDVYYIEADGDDSLVRLAGRKRRRDVRRLEQIELKLKSAGFFRIHRSYLINLDRVHFLRLRESRVDWEVALTPPVNKVLPVSRAEAARLMAALDQ